MKIREDKIREITQDLNTIIAAIVSDENLHQEALEKVDPHYYRSAQNLVHYSTFRKFDLRKTQRRLRNLGLTRFANAEGHILASLANTRYILNELVGDPQNTGLPSKLSIKKGRRLLTKNTKVLLGYRSKGRRVRIMVTQPTESAYNYPMVLEMVKHGMNCARVNCAHDSPEIWRKIIDNVKKAAAASGRHVKIAMDLAGPKIRTGKITAGPKIRKFTPEKDVTGNIIRPAELVLLSQIDEFSPPNALTLDQEDLAELKEDDSFSFTDTRDKKRKIKIVQQNGTHALAHCYETSYIGTGTEMYKINTPSKKIVVGELPPVEQALILRQGDEFSVVKEPVEGVPAIIDEDGHVTQKGVISCQLPEVFKKVKAGDRVLFDDGKIEGIVTSSNGEVFDVRIIMAKEKGSRLKAEKGINFPDTNLGISGLTDKDREDLEFVAKYADIVNFSFVNSPEDVEELYEVLRELNALDNLDVILKIETKYAVANLKDILLAAMRSKHIGVMIARGDLAVETGWDHIGKVQEEILLLCSAAHIPVVWATQVLENLAKKGLPSRSEITDATAALKAECIMLNKGPYINRTISLLNSILSDMEEHHEKKEVMLPKMSNPLS